MRATVVSCAFALLMTGCGVGERDLPASKSSRPAVKSSPTVRPSAARSTDEEPSPAQPPPVRFAAAPIGSTGYSMRSAIGGMRLFPTASLPASAARNQNGEGCDKMTLSDPATLGGRLARARGWRVTGEERLGRLTVVLIARNFYARIGGECGFLDGSAVLFDGKAVVGVLQFINPDFPIAIMEKKSGDILRFWTRRSQAPLGDLRLSGRELAFGPPAAMNSECHGRARVPDIFRLDVVRANNMLLHAGWKPLRLKPIDRDSGEYHRYYLRGVRSIDACSAGGRCQFRYRSGAGQLVVETNIPDPPDDPHHLPENGWVVYYFVDCFGRAGKLAFR